MPKGNAMVLRLSSELEAALAAKAQQRGIAPEIFAEEMLRKQLIPVAPPMPIEDWERRLFSVAVDCGVSVSDEALSSEGLYD
jgi:hypothetical protein